MKRKYIVRVGSFPTSDSYPENFIFKLKSPEEYKYPPIKGRFYSVLDCEGSYNNGWSFKFFRDATEEEASMYEKEGKPVDITKNASNINLIEIL